MKLPLSFTNKIYRNGRSFCPWCLTACQSIATGPWRTPSNLCLLTSRATDHHFHIALLYRWDSSAQLPTNSFSFPNTVCPDWKIPNGESNKISGTRPLSFPLLFWPRKCDPHLRRPFTVNMRISSDNCHYNSKLQDQRIESCTLPSLTNIILRPPGCPAHLIYF